MGQIPPHAREVGWIAISAPDSSVECKQEPIFHFIANLAQVIYSYGFEKMDQKLFLIAVFKKKIAKTLTQLHPAILRA